MRGEWNPENAMQRLRDRNAARHRKRVLEKVIERDGSNCFWCGGPTLMSSRKYLHRKSAPGRHHGEMRKLAPTLDHIIPVADGGPDTVENGLCACYACNRRRGSTEASVYLFQLIRAEPCASPVASRSAGEPPAAPNSASGFAATTGSTSTSRSVEFMDGLVDVGAGIAAMTDGPMTPAGCAPIGYGDG